MSDSIIPFMNSYSFGHAIDEKPTSTEFHLHEFFEIYFFISGKVNYFVEKKSYKMEYCDCMLMNTHEIHKPAFIDESRYERFTIHFDPQIARAFSPVGFDLAKCFTERPHGEKNKMNLSSQQKEELLKLFYKMECVRTVKFDGWQALSLTYLIEILVFLNRTFLSIKTEDERSYIPEKLKPILEYVEENLEGDLSLESFEAIFFINRFYLCRLFKNTFGSTLHEFIQYKRISKAKMLLASGTSVTDTCMQSGFGDYSNFIRMFKKTTGITPLQYSKKHR